MSVKTGFSPDQRTQISKMAYPHGRSPHGGIVTPDKHYKAGQFAPDRYMYAQEVVPPGLPPDLNHEHLRSLDLHQVEPSWDKHGKEDRNAYGGVIFNQHGHVLMVEPTNHYLGYVWTFPKGKLDKGEHPVNTGVREVKEESGHDASILGLLPKRFPSPTGMGHAQYFIMRSHGQTNQPHWETQSTRWATPEDAHAMINQTHTPLGRARDHEILNLAVKHFNQLKLHPETNAHLQPPVQRTTYEKHACDHHCACEKCSSRRHVYEKVEDHILYARWEQSLLDRTDRILYEAGVIDPKPGKSGQGIYEGGWIPNWHKEATPKDFVAARSATKRPSHVIPSIGTPLPSGEEDFSGHKIILSGDHKVGGLLNPHGDILGLFNGGGPKGAAAEAVMKLIREGGHTADGYDGFLPHYLAQFGFKETGRMKFNRDYAPKSWSYNYDEPDVVFMARPQGDPLDEESIRRQVHNRETWKPHKLAETYYDDWDKAKEDSRRGGVTEKHGETSRSGVGGQARGVGSGAGKGARGTVARVGAYHEHPLNPFGLKMGDTVNTRDPGQPEPVAYHVTGFDDQGLPYFQHASTQEQVPASQDFNSRIVHIRGYDPKELAARGHAQSITSQSSVLGTALKAHQKIAQQERERISREAVMKQALTKSKMEHPEPMSPTHFAAQVYSAAHKTPRWLAAHRRGSENPMEYLDDVHHTYQRMFGVMPRHEFDRRIKETEATGQNPFRLNPIS